MYTEKAPGTSPQLEQFERELDDLLEAGDLLKALPDKNDETIQNKDSYEKETRWFKKILHSTKQAYVDCVSADIPGYDHFVTVKSVL